MVTKDEVGSGNKNIRPIIPDVVYHTGEILGFSRSANIYAGNSLDPVSLTEFMFLYFYSIFVME